MRYTETHEWLDIDDDGIVTVGVTAHAAGELGAITFIDLPEVGQTITAEDEVAVIEADSDAREVLAPCDGEVVESNDSLAEDPGALGDDPEGGGWLFRMEIEDVDALEDLMTDAEYRSFVRS